MPWRKGVLISLPVRNTWLPIVPSTPTLNTSMLFIYDSSVFTVFICVPLILSTFLFPYLWNSDKSCIYLISYGELHELTLKFLGLCLACSKYKRIFFMILSFVNFYFCSLPDVSINEYTSLIMWLWISIFALCPFFTDYPTSLL